jgi:hypothetical protein
MPASDMITRAFHRLLERLGTDKERTALERNEPLQLPSEADLMRRAADEAARDPSAGTTNLRAALELAALDQRLAETREINLVTLLRQRGVPWREIAQHRGLQSAQAAQQRYRRLTEPPEDMIYAFRAADEKDAPWHGDHDALPDGQFRTGRIDFNPAMPRPYSGRTLELRYGPVEAEAAPAYLRAYAHVNGRRIPATAALQQELFGA